MLSTRCEGLPASASAFRRSTVSAGIRGISRPSDTSRWPVDCSAPYDMLERTGSQVGRGQLIGDQLFTILARMHHAQRECKLGRFRTNDLHQRPLGNLMQFILYFRTIASCSRNIRDYVGQSRLNENIGREGPSDFQEIWLVSVRRLRGGRFCLVALSRSQRPFA